MSEQEKPAEAPAEPAPDAKLSAAEKRALAARSNAFTEMGKILAQINSGTMAIALAHDGKTMVFANPGAVAQILNGLVQQVRQMDVALNALADLVLSEKHVQAVAFPDTDPDDDKAAPMLGPSKITREEYWLRVAALAQLNADTLRRGVLSQGAGAAVSRIIKPN